jgi:hypothetical protein
MENMKLGVTKEDDLLTPFQIIVRLSFFTLSLTICLIQKIVQNIIFVVVV